MMNIWWVHKAKEVKIPEMSFQVYVKKWHYKQEYLSTVVKENIGTLTNKHYGNEVTLREQTFISLNAVSIMKQRCL